VSAERINPDRFGEEKPPVEERPRSSGRPLAGAPPSRFPVSRDEPPPVRLSAGVSGAGKTPGRPKSPVAPPTPAVVKVAPSAPSVKVPTFSVSSFDAIEAGNNAIVTPRPGQLDIESTGFSSKATVHETSGDAEAVNWDVGYIQTAASHSLEVRWHHTVQHVKAATPVRDAEEGTAPPWYREDSKAPAHAGGATTVAMTDSPSVSLSWNDPRTGESNSLLGVTRQLSVRTWLIARNRVNAAIVYLKNVAWGIKFKVNVDSARRTGTNTGPGMVAPATGTGKGSGDPSFSDTVYNNLVKDPGNRETRVRGAGSAAKSQASRSIGAPAVQLNTTEPPRDK
jgi:hypothetical protein